MASPAGAPTPASSLPPQGASPRAIRDALTIPEDRAEFDREYKRALATAAETRELAGVHTLLEQWRRRAWVTHDREVYQRMMDRVDRLRRGEDVSSVPVEEVRAVIRERLGLQVYRVTSDHQVLEHVAALPIEALASYAELLVVLETVPWNADPVHKDNPPHIERARRRSDHTSERPASVARWSTFARLHWTSRRSCSMLCG